MSISLQPRDLNWARLDASSWEVAGEEVQGRTPHYWLRHPDFARTWLFKPALPDGDRPMGEDITEMLASRIAHLLGVPAAPVRLATRDAANGCLVEDLRWSKGEDHPGRVLLDSHLPDYDPDDPGRRGYSVSNIRRVLEGFGPPPGSTLPQSFEAFDAFVGYLVLDALIANTDRHDRNWAVLTPPPDVDGVNRLCGSYDHASCLAFNLTDEQRAQVLSSGTIHRFASRAHGRQFEHTPGQRRTPLVDIARVAAYLAGPETRAYWWSAVEAFDVIQWGTELETAELTPVTRRFIVALLTENRRRLVDALK
ncbi:HipA domain-containing protein [Blastococcus sp. BMG 814]|uniref:HipA domain-containing protein n=1 Tax=Blastococcus carthaginiensis TaxID=3050034 RepID=A0ABT9IK88_9ACTN|nr:HipA domain-containing protein [Blastococcus carthaginiensis]MDP5185500.1 HipA domain-containing protein [Blastococcus carthaginiensis]